MAAFMGDAASWQQPRFGVGLRRQFFDDILTHHDGVDFLEIVSENFMGRGGRLREVLQQARKQFTVVPHGVGLSIGSLDPLDETYLRELQALLAMLQPPWFSDHLSYSSAHGFVYHDLMPLPFSNEAVQHVVQRIDQVQQRMGIPFLLENPSTYLRLPGGTMGEAEFLATVAERANCGLLLDVNNVYVNCMNHQLDARAFIDALPADRVLQMHMAGHDDSGSFIIDTHGGRIHDRVMDLFQYTVRRIGPRWTLLEWDSDIPPLAQVLQENQRIRSAARVAQGGLQECA